MIFETIKSKGLAHFSYLIGDEYAGVCAIIDPRRDVEIYLDLAQRHNLEITHILETHIHADFVSGSRELAHSTGATICLSAGGHYEFEFQPLTDGEHLEIGRFTLRVLHTPGHTPEHICFLISGGKGAKAPWGLFTGDTLFAGEIGRPDLLGDDRETELAGQIFYSLHEKILKLGDEIQIFPAHGKGSPCGASVGERDSSTIGYERKNSPLLQIQSKDEFVKRTLASLSPAPAYYPRMKAINRQGPKPLRAFPHLKPLTAQEVRQLQQDPNVIILDTREIISFGAAHIAGAINIALRKSFPIWAGRVLDPKKNLILILEDSDKRHEVLRHLQRVGIDKVTGFLQKGMRGWIESGLPFERVGQMSLHELHQQVEGGNGLQVLDVRSDAEWQKGHIPTAQHIYVPDIHQNINQLDSARPVAVYCGSGYRASLAASLLKRHDFEEVYNVPGSISAWRSVDYELEDSP